MTRWNRIGMVVVVALAASFGVACNNVADAGPATAVAPAPGQIGGRWATNWGGSQVCELTLVQNGTAITGNYTTTGAPPGTVAGNFVNNVLTGTWTDQAGSTGGMALTFSPDGRTFTGTWGSGTSTTNGGSWTGRR